MQWGVGGGSTGRDLGNGVQHNMTEMVQHAVPALATGGTRQPRVVRAVAAHRGATGPRSSRIAPSVAVGPSWLLGIRTHCPFESALLLAKLAHGGSISALDAADRREGLHDVGRIDLGGRPAIHAGVSVPSHASPRVLHLSPAAPAAALVLQHAFGGLGDGGNAVGTALLGEVSSEA